MIDKTFTPTNPTMGNCRGVKPRIMKKKQITLKELETMAKDLLPTVKYIGDGMYNIMGIAIVNEKTLQKIDKEIAESL